MEKDDILDCLNGQANVFRGVNCTIHLNRILVLRRTVMAFLISSQLIKAGKRRKMLLNFFL